MFKFGRSSKRKKRKSPFWTTPFSFDTPFPAKPANIWINLTLLETRPMGSVVYIFAAGSMCLSPFNLFWSAPKNTMCNVTECIMAVRGQLKVNQGRWFGYQSKVRIQLSVCDQLQVWSCLAPFRRSSSLNFENRQFIPTLVLYDALARGYTPFKSRDELGA